ncbi:MAG: PAS domain-containing protein [Gammaproteobacteria bacterium]|nr:PAS domain-containing protein [Gammaproteobacteria bacterium]
MAHKNRNDRIKEDDMLETAPYWLTIIASIAMFAALAWAVMERRRRLQLRGEMDTIIAKEEQRREERQSLQSVIERDAHGILTVDRSGKVVYANSTSEKIFGRSRTKCSVSPIDPYWTLIHWKDTAFVSRTTSTLPT